MCLYRLEISVLTRASGQNAVAAAAYRAGVCLTDMEEFFTGAPQTFDYRRKGGVVTSGLILPDDAPSELKQRQALWNAAERLEGRKNSRIAREALIALPHELNDAQRHEAVKRFARHLMERYRVGVDYAIHRPSKHSDDRNHHAHVLFTTRQITAGGFGGKTRALDDKRAGPKEVEALRAVWEDVCNMTLKQAQRMERVSRKSLRARNIHRLPEVKQGAVATSRARKHRSSHAARERASTRAYNEAVGQCPASEQPDYIKQARSVLKRLRRENRSVAWWLSGKAMEIQRELQRRKERWRLLVQWRQSVEAMRGVQKLQLETMGSAAVYPRADGYQLE